ncbi:MULTISPECIES: 2-amino-4-hydroxy-6-hydroxymethyldihydropteridine diphosphokinase [unclassified Novosphingobium]|uniref:2-amino-4-hydroxy-6- hydroxymethyldihydropteridine diphosphokinase n=1 Tax=Novosphingobium TaxID=165696 RepID=UPI00146A5576|nr:MULTISPECIES: 2-amino-4-hydroxy-6-hydroxymethyldihydropteridine diphosphokinase [unclassified Novosphingobium]NMN03083.1 2-amino-4-hydroxy-6-hydroxymethyldihydropteridine diphosphokinase [Novosphingobium sp. SG919]NMN86929.1 2-amino-4-hydroxy-6-hydroxymethyldihydropteridine diphosphokinase [Novosphingobium sp. SG916]
MPAATAAPHQYLIALGSNVRHARHGAPAQVLRAAARALDDAGLVLQALSPIIASAPVGPSRRRYANACAVITTPLEPAQVLARLQALEHSFGRVRRGAPWRARTLDLDIVLWSGGALADIHANLVIPHPACRQRPFVMGPAVHVAADWRDPLTGLATKHLASRLTRRRPAPR